MTTEHTESETVGSTQPNVAGPFGVADASAAVVRLCEEAQGMLQAVQQTTWWRALVQK